VGRFFFASRTLHAHASGMSNRELEEGGELRLDFTKLKKVAACGQDLVPAVAQDHDTGEVLIIGYVNQLALETALQERKATFWSTSRNELWIKGKTSGDYLELIEVRVNCEQNSLLYRVRLAGRGSCHTKGKDGQARLGCFYRRVKSGQRLEFVPGHE
jgi:phosphoribosyl-AMP cyclohydrolase